MPIDDGIRGAGPAARRDCAPHVRGPSRSGAAVVAVLHDLNLAHAAPAAVRRQSAAVLVMDTLRAARGSATT